MDADGLRRLLHSAAMPVGAPTDPERRAVAYAGRVRRRRHAAAVAMAVSVTGAGLAATGAFDEERPRMLASPPASATPDPSPSTPASATPAPSPSTPAGATADPSPPKPVRRDNSFGWPVRGPRGDDAELLARAHRALTTTTGFSVDPRPLWGGEATDGRVVMVFQGWPGASDTAQVWTYVEQRGGGKGRITWEHPTFATGASIVFGYADGLLLVVAAPHVRAVAYSPDADSSDSSHAPFTVGRIEDGAARFAADGATCDDQIDVTDPDDGEPAQTTNYECEAD